MHDVEGNSYDNNHDNKKNATEDKDDGGVDNDVDLMVMIGGAGDDNSGENKIHFRDFCKEEQ